MLIAYSQALDIYTMELSQAVSQDFFLGGESWLNIYQHVTLYMPNGNEQEKVVLLSSAFSDLLRDVSCLPGHR